MRYRDEDEAYEEWRQREVDEMTFPSDETLIARGKYSTLARERRETLKALRVDMEALSDNARRILRAAELGADYAPEEIEAASRHVGAAQGHLIALTALAHHLSALKPLAWGKGEPE